MSDPAQAVQVAAVNHYAPPRAALAEAALARSEPLPAPLFAVGIAKFVAMSVCTGNLYLVYWCYRNWQAVRNFGRRPNCAMRALAWPFTSYWLLRRMRAKAAAVGVRFTFPPAGIAWMLLLFALVSFLPNGFALLTLGAAAALIPVQREVNALNCKLAPLADSNEDFSPANLGVLVLGGLFLLLSLLGAAFARGN
jgi:hypothetical protein